MRNWFETDWSKVFTPQLSLPEILVRGVLVYLSLCLMLRVVLKRQAGRVSLSDLLVVTLVGGVCRNPLVADAYSITDGMLVVATVLSCSYVVDWLSYRVSFVHDLLHPKPLPLIQGGEVLKKNLRRELMTEKQLHSKLRAEGVQDPVEVAEAIMEGDGHVTVIKRNLSAALPAPAPSLNESLSANGTGSTNGTPRPQERFPASDGTTAVQDFVRAADHLRSQLAWYQQQSLEIKQLLNQHGVRSGALSKRSRSRPNQATPHDPQGELDVSPREEVDVHRPHRRA